MLASRAFGRVGVSLGGGFRNMARQGSVPMAQPVMVGGVERTGMIWELERCNCGQCNGIDIFNCRSGNTLVVSNSTSTPSTSSSSGFGTRGQRRGYHEAVIDHFNSPRNVGKLDSKKANVGSWLVGKASCGDVIKLQIEVDPETDTILDAKFKTFGCGSAIASSSLATEMIMNQPLSEWAKLRNTDISGHLNLPPIKVHCSVLAEEAIQNAIADYRKKQTAAAA